MVVNEFQEAFGDVLLDLSQSTSRSLIDRLVDLRPNQLGDSFKGKNSFTIPGVIPFLPLNCCTAWPSAVKSSRTGPVIG